MPVAPVVTFAGAVIAGATGAATTWTCADPGPLDVPAAFVSTAETVKGPVAGAV
jgi:hypothetical protein